MQKPFTPITLTGTSSSEEFGKNTTRQSYSSLCENANFIKFSLEGILTDHEDTGMQLTLDFLKSKDPLKFIKLKFVEAKNIQVPGLKPSAFIEGDMLDIPQEPLEAVLADRAAFDLAYAKACEKFDYPLKNLYVTEDSCGLFAVGESFDKALCDYFSESTSNEFENTIVEAMDAYIEAVNTLIVLGVVHPGAQWVNEVAFIFQSKYAPLNMQSERPLSLSRHAIDTARKYSRKLIAKQNAEQAEQVDNTPEQAEPVED
jgi:hypothetical protein